MCEACDEMVISSVRARVYRIDGGDVTTGADILDANESDPEVLMALASLRIGETREIGGGAFASFEIERVA